MDEKCISSDARESGILGQRKSQESDSFYSVVLRVAIDLIDFFSFKENLTIGLLINQSVELGILIAQSPQSPLFFRIPQEVPFPSVADGFSTETKVCSCAYCRVTK